VDRFSSRFLTSRTQPKSRVKGYHQLSRARRWQN
jgi:hypothetical protein